MPEALSSRINAACLEGKISWSGKLPPRVSRSIDRLSGRQLAAIVKLGGISIEVNGEAVRIHTKEVCVSYRTFSGSLFHLLEIHPATAQTRTRATYDRSWGRFSSSTRIQGTRFVVIALSAETARTALAAIVRVATKRYA